MIIQETALLMLLGLLIASYAVLFVFLYRELKTVAIPITIILCATTIAVASYLDNVQQFTYTTSAYDCVELQDTTICLERIDK